MNFQDRFDEAEGKFKDEATAIFLDVVKHLHSQGLDILTKSSTNSSDDGGSTTYTDFFLVLKQIPQGQEDIINSLDETDDDDFETLQEKFMSFIKNLNDFDIPNDLMESNVDFETEWDNPILNYFRTNANGVLEKVSTPSIFDSAKEYDLLY